MSVFRQAQRNPGPSQANAAGPACPSCAAHLAADANRCPSCGFTGGDTLRLFSDPPPLLPVLDAAELWSGSDLKRIETAREKLRRAFPQFHFHICSVMLPEGAKLPLFGFWLLNVCPFYVNETAADRAWSVLLLIDARSGSMAVVPGYSAERWLTDEDWSKALWSMAPRWKAGRSSDAVIRFLETAGTFLGQAWKARGSRRSKHRHS